MWHSEIVPPWFPYQIQWIEPHKLGFVGVTLVEKMSSASELLQIKVALGHAVPVPLCPKHSLVLISRTALNRCGDRVCQGARLLRHPTRTSDHKVKTVWTSSHFTPHLVRAIFFTSLNTTTAYIGIPMYCFTSTLNSRWQLAVLCPNCCLLTSPSVLSRKRIMCMYSVPFRTIQ